MFRKPTIYEFDQFKQEIEAFKESAQKEQKQDLKSQKNTIEKKELKPIYVPFDPNGLSEEQWHMLGLSDRQIKVIKNYESKGGKFYKKEDLKKIYSIKPDQYTQLEPYISIQVTKSTTSHPSSSEFKSNQNLNSINTRIVIDLNEADSSKLETVRGIGPAFASRIIKYRNRLGGFHSKDQLREVYGLDSIKYEQIKDQLRVSGTIRKININTSTFNELKTHPYLNYKQINAIIQYRKQHGNYTDIDDLHQVSILNPEFLRKIAPYLSF
jgi:competence ComEA-like helix-hairpin-helix protein